MAEAIVLGLARKISGYIGDLAVDQVVSWWGVNDDLTKLNQSIRIIKAVLIDADHKQQVQGITDALSKEWLRRLRRVLYKADDLFDEVFTVKQQMSESLKEGNRMHQLGKKVLYPFSKSGPIRFNFYVAGEIKSIRKELDVIKRDLDLSAFNLLVSGRGESMPLMACSRNKWETASSVNPQNIVGREHDKNDIIEMLLSESDIDERSISVIPIVGFGGIGKTTLAQLVFNDDRVKNHFELAKWAWVPEKDKKNEMMGKIFQALTGRDYHGLSLEQLKSEIRDSIKDKRYLLVLDDVWDESRNSWVDLMDLLGCGGRESKIIVTTRSFVVANNVGTLPTPWSMDFLSDEESWDLFQKLAFKPGSNPNLIPIGTEIVKKCGNVPLAIKAIGSALYSKDKEIEWRQFKDCELSKIDQTGSIDIMPALKLSYDQLPSQLKQCFAYCALYKKCFSFSRNIMVYEWMALGFILSSNEDCNLDLEDVGHRYFEDLLSRNFFQDATPPDQNEDVGFRIHDLMLDLATHVADDVILVECASRMMDDVKEQFHGDLRHVFVSFDTSDLWEASSLLPHAREIRSLILFRALKNNTRIQRWKNMLSNFIHLRCLNLTELRIEMVPDSIGELRHLRYLFIFKCPAIKCLPPSIKKLWNLQTLMLVDCSKLATLPIGISRLINLRWMFLHGCNLLTETPAGFHGLKFLQRLSHFMVGKNNGLDALTDMNLRGDLVIDYRIWRENTISEARKANLKGKQRLSSLTLQLGSLAHTLYDPVFLLEVLQPPQSLKKLHIAGYRGKRLPCWMGLELHTRIPDLVDLTFESFKKCRFLPLGLSQLPLLRSLDLSELTTLEYVEISGKGIRIEKYFPCLQYLKLSKLPQLRGWFRVALEEDDIDGNEDEEEEDEEEDGDGSYWLMFPCLETLEIYECPELISMPFAPRLQTLIAKDIHWSLLIGAEAVTRCCPELTVLDLSSVHDLFDLVLKSMLSLKSLKISDCLQLTRITVEPPSSINRISIKGCQRLREIQGLHHLSSSLDFLCINDCEDLDELPTNLGSLTALQRLQIWKLPRLIALPPSISNLPALLRLNIANCPELTSFPDSLDNFTHLRFLRISRCPKMSSYISSSSFSDLLCCFTLLKKLYLVGFPDLTALPESIRHLPHIYKLKIGNCPQLTVLPDWFTNLPALQTLHIFGCPHLSSRCKEPDGKDLPLIRHIPNVILKD